MNTKEPGASRSRRLRPRVALAGTVLAGTVLALTAGVMTPVAAKAAAVWSSPLTLAVVNGTPSPALVTAGQPGGTAVVAWTSSGQLLASVRTPAAKWLAVTAVSPKNETATSPAMVIRPDGSIVAAWVAQRATDAVIESANWTSAGGWSPPVVVSLSGMASAGPVDIATDGSGTVLAAWGQHDQSGVISVTTASLPVAGSWSTPVILATPPTSFIRQVSVAVNSSGAAVAGWIWKTNDLFGAVTTRPAGGSFGPPVTIASGPWRPALQQLHSMSVAIDEAGRASAAWNNSFTNASVQLASGAWAQPTVFAQGYASNPALAVDATGTAQLLWAVGGGIQASTLPPGGTWAPASSVFPGTNPLDVGQTGSIAGWYDSNTRQINSAVHTSSGWGTAVAVSRPLPSSPWVAGVSIAPAGTGAIIAWISGTGSQGTVQVSASS